MNIRQAILLLPLLSGCVSIDLPGVVSDTARVTKDAYRSVTGKKAESEPVTPIQPSINTVANTYIGKDNQTVADVKQACINEAAAKLFSALGKDVLYTVIEDSISTVNNQLAATCKVSAAMSQVAPKQ
jgi:hypothetical protein